MNERKILIEVTPEEYERIKVGALEKDVPTYEQIKKEMISNLSEDDINEILSNRHETVMKNMVDEELLTEIVRRTRSKGEVYNKTYEDAHSMSIYTILSGELNNIKKRDYSKIDEPIIESKDTFSWTIKHFEERL